MKFFTTGVAFLLLTTTVAAKASVEVLQVSPSSQNAKITVLHDGKPLQDVKIDVFTAGEQLRLYLSTAGDGVIVLPLLPRGRYHIAANAAGNLGADLVLNVSRLRNKQPSEFSLLLFVRPPRPPTLEQRIAAVEGSGAIERLQKFKGIVVDPAGAGIRQVKIQIFQEGSGGKDRVATTKSDATGHFSAHLVKGTYTAMLQAQGFSAQIQVFEITEEGVQKDLRIRLDLGPVT